MLKSVTDGILCILYMMASYIEQVHSSHSNGFKIYCAESDVDKNKWKEPTKCSTGINRKDS